MEAVFRLRENSTVAGALRHVPVLQLAAEVHQLDVLK